MNPFPIGRSATARHPLQPAVDHRQALARLGRHASEGNATVRRARASDAEALQEFIMGLSATSRRMRFHGAVNSCTPALLQYLTQIDHVRHQAWFAVDLRNGDEALVGEARFVVSAEGTSAELAIAIADDRRGHGVADRLLHTVLGAASRAGVDVLFADVLAGNAPMSGFLRRHGFRVDPSADVDPGVLRWQRRLGVAGAGAGNDSIGPSPAGH